MISKSASGKESELFAKEVIRILTRRLPIYTGVLLYWVSSYFTNRSGEHMHTSKVLNVDS
jgi:hypothetical protein